MPPPEAPLHVGALALDIGLYRATVDGREVGLTKTEFLLLAALVHARGRVVPHARLLSAGWPGEHDPDPQWLKPHVARLRAKLVAAGGPVPASVRGVGYRLADEGPDSPDGRHGPGAAPPAPRPRPAGSREHARVRADQATRPPAAVGPDAPSPRPRRRAPR